MKYHDQKASIIDDLMKGMKLRDVYARHSVPYFSVVKIKETLKRAGLIPWKKSNKSRKISPFT